MPLRKKVFYELNKLNLKSGYIWTFQQYHSHFNVHLNDNEKLQFNETMENLCKEGVVSCSYNGNVPVYRLTEKGENIINQYKN